MTYRFEIWLLRYNLTVGKYSIIEIVKTLKMSRKLFFLLALSVFCCLNSLVNADRQVNLDEKG